jgi:hypothetical protein
MPEAGDKHQIRGRFRGGREVPSHVYVETNLTIEKLSEKYLEYALHRPMKALLSNQY